MSKTLPIHGAYTALVTPFTPDGAHVDFDALERLVHRQIEQGIDGLLPCGTTGESPTLHADEHLEVIRRTAKAAAGRVPVIAGTGSNSTEKSISTSKAALEAGADGVMIVSPYYNKPSQEGLVRHMTAVARAVGDAPVILYNIPGRSVVELSVDTIARIADEASNVVAVKDATGNIVRCQQVRHRLGDRLTVMCGDDGLTVGMMAVGASGVISVTSNVFPKQVSDICHAAAQGHWSDALKMHMALLSVHEVMFVEPNPGPAKVAMAHLKLMNTAVRLPLVVPTQASQKLVIDAMRAYQKERA